MAGPLDCRKLCQNSFSTGKNELAGLFSIEGSDTYTLAPAVSHAPTPDPPTALAPAFALAAVNSTFRYLEADF